MLTSHSPHDVNRASKAKTHPIYTDTSHNSSRAVRINIYQALVLAAMKMHGYMRAARTGSSSGLAFLPKQLSSSILPDFEEDERPKEMGVKARKKARGSGAFLLSTSYFFSVRRIAIYLCLYVAETIRQSIRYTYTNIRNKASGNLARQSDGCCDVSKDEVLWCALDHS